MNSVNENLVELVEVELLFDEELPSEVSLASCCCCCSN